MFVLHTANLHYRIPTLPQFFIPRFSQAQFDKTTPRDKIPLQTKMETLREIKPAVPGDSAVTKFLVNGMTCANCARHVTEAIQSIPSVRNATVSLENKKATVRWNPGAMKNVFTVIETVKSAGYEAKEIDAATDGCRDSGYANGQINLWSGISVTIFLMIGEWIFRLGVTRWFQWLSFALAGIVQIFCGTQFYRGAWNQLKIGGSNMDTLVALGSTTAFAYSTWALLSGTGGEVYFMEAAAIITLISLGHRLETRVSTRASDALEKLLNLAPQTARRKNSDGSESEIPIVELKINDLVILKPGDCVPTDGIVVEGDSAVDEAMLNGESVPADKKSGGGLFAGTVNLNGRLVMRVAATGESTALAHIITAVQRAQTSRADIQRLGDRVSRVFVPMVVAVAIAAGFFWKFAPASANKIHDALAQIFWHSHAPVGAAAGFIIAAAVLIVACPCAMGLATPVAIMAGVNAAVRRGILIRDGVTLEKAGKISAIIFDKTGTLTIGKPEVAAENSDFGSQKPEVRVLAAALARSSTHLISQAIAKLSADKIEVKDWKEIRGAGVEAKTSNSEAAQLGSLRWLKESGVDLSFGEKFIAEWSNQSATIVGLAVENSLSALFAVKDGVKPNAAQVVAQLQREGLEIFLVTGDNALTATGIAKQVGIAAENVFAGVRPEEKAGFVKKLQAQGRRVAFVGDGINDAPALEQADLGIAVSRASDVAREAADIILLKSEIEAVPEALGLARATLRTIKQNLFWAFFYNALGVPLAAMGFISPIFCAAAMGASDLIVIGNALRLLRWRQ
jgi:P-type Cu+ transporter